MRHASRYSTGLTALRDPPSAHPRRAFLSYGNEVSYTIRKNPAKQDSPPAAGRVSDILPFRRSAILAERLLSYGNEVSYTIIKKDSGARRSLFSSSLNNRIFTQRAFCCFHMIFDGLDYMTFRSSPTFPAASISSVPSSSFCAWNSARFVCTTSLIRFKSLTRLL